MNVTCLLASPRANGNSAGIARRFLEKAEALGAQVSRFELNKMNYRGCQGCDACKTRLDHCAVEDDLKNVLETVRQTDILVLATPVYFADVPSQLKAFIDRTYSFVDADFMTNPNASRLEKGKKLVFIQTQEAGEESYGDIYQKYAFFFQFYGFEDCRLVRACKVGQTRRIAADHIAFQQAAEVAEKLCAENSPFEAI